MNLGRYHLVWVVFKTMLNSYSHENSGLFYFNTYLHIQWHLIFLHVQLSFVAFPSKMIVHQGCWVLSPIRARLLEKPSNKQHHIQRYWFISNIRIWIAVADHSNTVSSLVALGRELILKCKKITRDPVLLHTWTLGWFLSFSCCRNVYSLLQRFLTLKSVTFCKPVI